MGINKAETKIKFGPYDVTGAESIKFEPEIVEEESDGYVGGIANCCLVNVEFE